MSKSSLQPNPHTQDVDYDVVVLGAGSGGVAAAIQAARLGAKTLLLEPSAHIGGQLLSVPTLDEGHVEGEGYPIRKVGIYAEFIERIREIYRRKGKSVATCYWREDSIAFEPQVAEEVLIELLEGESSLTLSRKTSVEKVHAKDSVITGMTTTRGETLSSRIVIDATETGDLLPLTPARYRIGKSTSDRIDPGACLQDISYPAVIKKYPGGAPDHLVMSDPPPGFEEHRAQFEATVHEQGYNWYRNDCGEDQDKPCWGKYPVNWLTHHAYRGLPDSKNPRDYDAGARAAEITKTLINWANDIPVNNSYLEDKKQRQADIQRAKRKTLAFIYYLQQQLGTEWALSDDDFDNQVPRDLQLSPPYQEMDRRLPPHPYVRESRRIIPVYTLTGRDIKRQGSPPRAVKRFPHAVAVGYYPADLHGCQEEGDFNPRLEGKEDIPTDFASGPFQIPFASLIPEKVDGLLAAEKNIGVSRIANGATRLQPITMVVGQAVGAIAGLAVNHGCQPRQVDPLDVQWALLHNGIKLSPGFYEDVPRGHPLWKAVELASTRQWLDEKRWDNFGIQDPLTRAELAKALCLFEDVEVPEAAPERIFRDVKPGAWVAPYVTAASRRYPFPPSRRGEGWFCPTDPVRGEELPPLLAAIHPDMDPGQHTPPLIDPATGTWHEPWSQLLDRAGINPGEITLPRSKLTRGAMAALLTALAVYRGDTPG